MKVAPVSADLLIKVALVAVSLGALWYMLNRATGTAAAAAAWIGETADNVIETATNAVQAVNPLNNENLIYKAANTLTGGTDKEPLGGRIYNFFNPPPQDVAGNFEEIWGTRTDTPQGHTAYWKS